MQVVYIFFKTQEDYHTNPSSTCLPTRHSWTRIYIFLHWIMSWLCDKNNLHFYYAARQTADRESFWTSIHRSNIRTVQKQRWKKQTNDISIGTTAKHTCKNEHNNDTVKKKIAQKWPANEYTFKLYFFRRTPSHYFSFLFCIPIVTLTMTFLKTHPQPSRTSSDTRRWGSHSSIKSTLAVNRDNKGTTTGALGRMRARTRRPGSHMEDDSLGWLDG